MITDMGQKTAAGSVTSCPILMTVCPKGRNHLFNEVVLLKHSTTAKIAVEYKATTKSKKQCQMLQSLRKKKSKSDKL